MSTSALDHVKGLDNGMTAREKLLMMIIANYYNDSSGCAWPTVKRLAEDALLTERHVYNVINSLRAKGLLAVSSGKPHRTTNRYSFPGLNGGPGTMAPVPHDRSDLSSPLNDTCPPRQVRPEIRRQSNVNEPLADDDPTASAIEKWAEDFWSQIVSKHDCPVFDSISNHRSYFSKIKGTPPISAHTFRNWRWFVSSVNRARQWLSSPSAGSPLVIPEWGLTRRLLPIADRYAELEYTNVGQFYKGIRATVPDTADWSDALASIAKLPDTFCAAFESWEKPEKETG